MEDRTTPPLVRMSDHEVAYWAGRQDWTLTEALFVLNGYKPPGYELSARQLRDHFGTFYDQAMKAIEAGEICRPKGAA